MTEHELDIFLKGYKVALLLDKLKDQMFEEYFLNLGYDREGQYFYLKKDGEDEFKHFPSIEGLIEFLEEAPGRLKRGEPLDKKCLNNLGVTPSNYMIRS